MPWTLYRYILREVLKVLAVSTVVLVCVISFAAAIKPLSDGLLDPPALVKFVLFIWPTFLGFIVPFAAAFAATLVFHRMSSENEIVACSASGLSYRAIMLPVVFLGVVLMLTLFFLSNWVVPAFHRYTASLLQQDITKLVVSRVQQGRPVFIGDTVLHADRADDRHPPPYKPDSAVQPVKLIVLEGIAVGQRDKDNRLRLDVTAQRADVLLYEIDGQTWLTMRLTNVAEYDPTRGQMFAVDKLDVGQVKVPSLLRDDPKFLSWPELDKLRDHPERYDRIKTHKIELRQQIACEQLLQALASGLRDNVGGRVVLLGPQPGEEFIVTAPHVQRVQDTLVLRAAGSEKVRVRKYMSGLPSILVEAGAASLSLEVSEPLAEPDIRIRCEDAQVFDETLPGRGTGHSVYALGRTRWQEPVIEPLLGTSAAKLTEQVSRDKALRQIKPIRVAANRLRESIQVLQRRIEVQLHKRAAAAMSCLLTLLLGAVLSAKLRHSLPLVVFFWTFLLAVLVTIMIHTSDNIAGNPNYAHAVGLAYIWSGTLLLAGVIVAVYMKLVRN